VDQQFESNVEHDFMTDSPTVSAEEPFEEESYEDSFEGDSFEEEGMEEDAVMDEMDQYDEDAEAYGDEAYFGEEEFEDGFEEEFEDEFAQEKMDVMADMEEAVADALDAEYSDEFLRRLISGIRGVAGAVSRGVGQVGRVAGRRQRVAGQVGRGARGVQGVAGGIAGDGTQRRRKGSRSHAGITGSGAMGSSALHQLLPMLQQHAAQGANEMSLFEIMADWFEQENADEALPVLAGVAARAALRPLSHHSGAVAGQAVRRQIVREATQAARNLVSRQGPQAVRALRPIATSVGRIAAQRGLKPAALPGAIRQATASVAAQPALVRRLSQPTMRTDRSGVSRSRVSISGSGVPRRFMVNGPV
jgi:hypothetical protein